MDTYGTTSWLGRGRRCLTAFVAAASLVGTTATAQTAQCRRDDLTYDQVQQRSIHNAYDKAEALMDQLVYYRIRNVEIDLRADPPNNPYYGSGDVNDWHVYHVVGDQGRGKLSDYLRMLRAFHDTIPRHEVVTLTLELKGGDLGSAAFAFDLQGQHRTPAGLDERLRSQLGPKNLFTPHDLMARCPAAKTLQDALAFCGWPTLAELRGKFIVTVHEWNWDASPPAPTPFNLSILSPDAQPRNFNMYWYAGVEGADATSRVAFIAPLFLWRSDAKLASVPWAVFNTELKDDPGSELYGPVRALEIRHEVPRFSHLILRSADTGNDAESFSLPERTDMNFLLTDTVSWHDRPWVGTHNHYLYPFCQVGVVGNGECFDGANATSSLHERQHLLEMDVRSGDLDGSRDSFVFAFDAQHTTSQTEWSALVSDASNGDDAPPHAKGCLMARHSTSPSSAYYAICRHGDDEQLQVHYRLPGCRGGCGTVNEAASFPYDGEGMHGEDATFMRLVLTPQGRGVVAQAFGSLDAREWHEIGKPVPFSQRLSLQGIAASSFDPNARTRDGRSPRFLFADVAETVDGVRRRYFPNAAAGIDSPVWGPVGSLPYLRNIGRSATGDLIDRSYPPASLPMKITSIVPDDGRALHAARTSIDGVTVAWVVSGVSECVQTSTVHLTTVAKLRSGATVPYDEDVTGEQSVTVPLVAGRADDPVRSVSVHLDATAATEENEPVVGAADKTIRIVN